MADPINPAGTNIIQQAADQLRINDLDQVTNDNISLSQVFAIDFPTSTLKMSLLQLIEFTENYQELDTRYLRLDTANNPLTANLEIEQATPGTTAAITVQAVDGGSQLTASSGGAATRIYRLSADGNQVSQVISQDATETTIRHSDNTEKIATTDTGATVTGLLNVDGVESTLSVNTTDRFFTRAANGGATRVLDWNGWGIVGWAIVNSDGALIDARGVVSSSRSSAGNYVVNCAFSTSGSGFGMIECLTQAEGSNGGTTCVRASATAFNVGIRYGNTGAHFDMKFSILIFG